MSQHDMQNGKGTWVFATLGMVTVALIVALALRVATLSAHTTQTAVYMY